MISESEWLDFFINNRLTERYSLRVIKEEVRNRIKEVDANCVEDDHE